MDISERKKKILCMAIEEYIKDSSPITSGGIKDVTALNCSTATLRNELNALEAMGFLRQLHTSGGRVPTPQGYRFYVENLLENVNATSKELENVQQVISDRTRNLNEMVSTIADFVSRKTNYPTVVMLNDIDDLMLQEFRLLPLLDDKVMVLIGTSEGYLNNTLDISASMQECQDASEYLTKNFKGTTISFFINNIEQLKEGMQGEIQSFQLIVNSLVGGLKRISNLKALDVRRGGSARLLEGGSVEDAKKVLNLLDDEDKLRQSLAVSGNGIEVAVAAETTGEEVSVVKAPILLHGRQLASIGVIGPQRMDYMAIASALKVVIDQLNNLKGGEGE